MAFPSESPDLWYDVAKDQLTQQLSDVDGADAKLGVFLSTGSALIALLAAVYAIRPERFNGWEIALLAVSGVVYVGLALLILLALWGRSWGEGPELRSEWADQGDLSERELKWRFASRYQLDYETNQGPYELKRIGLQAGAIVVVAETVCVAAALVFAVLH